MGVYLGANAYASTCVFECSSFNVGIMPTFQPAGRPFPATGLDGDNPVPWLLRWLLLLFPAQGSVSWPGVCGSQGCTACTGCTACVAHGGTQGPWLLFISRVWGCTGCGVRGACPHQQALTHCCAGFVMVGLAGFGISIADVFSHRRCADWGRGRGGDEAVP